MPVVNAIVTGVAVGAAYAMLAVGFSLLWQTSRTVNFAQGEFASIPMFFFFWLSVKSGVPTYLAAVLTVVLSIAIFGYGFRHVVMRRLLGRGLSRIIIGTMALSLLLESAIVVFWTSQPQRAPALYANHVFVVSGIRVTTMDIVNVIVALVIVGGLEIFLRRSKPGNALRAVAQNRFTAEVLGIDTGRIVTLAFVINAGLASVVGILVEPIFLVKFDNGIMLALVAFYAAIIGGFNRIRGAVAGGIAIGVIQAITAVYLPSQYQDAIVLAVLLIVILARPQGLFGTREVVEYR